MKKYKSKREVLEKWRNKIDNQKHYYDILKTAGTVKNGFYSSDIYKELDRKRNKAIWRYDNREKISKQRKEIRVRNKEIDNYYRESIGEIDDTFSGTFIDAFKGRRGAFDMDFAKGINHKHFEGVLSIKNSDGEKIYENKFFSIPGYFRELFRWINKIFSGKDSNMLTNNSVTKKNFYSSKNETLYYDTNIIIENDDE